MFNVVILDFDDTLCLTEYATFLLENEIAKEMGYEPMSHEIHKQTWGRPLQDIITTRIPGINATDFMQRLGKRLSQYIKNGILDNITEENLRVLRQLKSAGKQLAIVTSRSLIEVKHLLHENHPLQIC